MADPLHASRVTKRWVGLYFASNWVAVSTEGLRLAPIARWPPSWRTRFVAQPRRWLLLILVHNRSVMQSAEGSLQSGVMAFQRTGVMPSERATLNTTGRRAPKGGRK